MIDVLVYRLFDEIPDFYFSLTSFYFSPISRRALAVEKKEQGLRLSNTSILGVKMKIQNLIKQSEEKDSKNPGKCQVFKGKS